MKQDEINEAFRDLIRDLSEKGYKKTNIGKILFGLNAFSQVDKFIKGIDNPEEKINFGLSPLNKIGTLVDYNLHLIYIDPNDRELLELIYKKNEDFLLHLRDQVKNYLDNNIQNKKSGNTDPDKLKRDVDEILSYLL